MSMFGGNVPSLADIAAVTRNNDGDGFGGNNGAWWILIILFALNGGWGNNNRGGCESGGCGMSGGYGFTEAAIQRGFDNQSVINKLNGLENGVCNLGYEQLAQTNGLSTTVMQTGFGLQNVLRDNAVAGLQQANALSTQFSDCCCDLRAAIKDVMYAMASDTCDLKSAIHEVGDRITNNQQWGFNALQQTIRDGFTEMQRDNDRRYIAELERKLNTCDRDSALQGWARYVVDQVRPTPIPSWDVPYPWARANSCCDSCNTCCR